MRDPKLFGRILHPDDRHRVDGASKPPDPRRLHQIDYRLLARDGRVVWVRDEATTVLDGTGKPLCIQGYLQDVSERKLADEDRKQLRAAEATATAGVIDRQRTVDFLGACRGRARLVARLPRHDQRGGQHGGPRVTADWCIVDRLEEDGNDRARRRGDPPPGGSEDEPEVDVLEVVKQRGPQLTSSRIEVPLVSHGRRTLGALTLIRRRAARRVHLARSRLGGRVSASSRWRSIPPACTTRSSRARRRHGCSRTSATASCSSTAPA